MRFQAPRGTHDILPQDSYKWQLLEKSFRDITSQYGYHEIRTPIFEDTELFVRSSGETSDIVTKEMYTFYDKSNRSLTLKPEGTPGAARAYIEHGLASQGGLVRLWYAIPIFRYDRPQKGRYRQSHQLGLELIGSPSPTADAEIIEITVRFYESIGISNVSVLLNSIGRFETRRRYAEALLEHAKPLLNKMPPEIQQRASKNPMRLLDNKDPEIIQAMEGAPNILNYLEDQSKQHFDKLQELLCEANISFVVDPKIVRGLDYYTDTVFEIQSSALGAQSSLCGGGRYDSLLKQLGGGDIPSVGVAIGMERALLTEPKKIVEAEEPRLDVYVVAANDVAQKKVRDLARKLRDLTFSANYDLDYKSLKAQLKNADRMRARYAALIGEDELKQESVTMRNLETGQQNLVKLHDVPNWVKAHII